MRFLEKRLILENNSDLIENETLTDLKDRRKVDDLLGCLLFLSKYHNRETSAESLTFGLPIHKTSMNISMFHQASSRIGLSTTTSFSILLLKLYSGFIIITSPVYSL